MTRRTEWRLILAPLLLAGASDLAAYPLDGLEYSGIRRLEGYQLDQQRPGTPKLARGALLPSEAIQLRLLEYKGPDFDGLPMDAVLQQALQEVLQPRDPSYALVLVDYSPGNPPRWAGLQADSRNNAGSVGKLLCATALFDSLARAFPDEEQRAGVMRETMVRAGDWVISDEHKVPRWNLDSEQLSFAVAKPEDAFRLSEWLDHAISASANAAGTVIWREAMLLRHFGADYPVSWEESEAFFADTRKAELAALAQQVIVEPLQAAGIDTENLRQGTFWTKASQRKVPGSQSFATPRELARLLFRMEEGRLVDRWSSLELKKYLYMTKRRYRYVYAPELSGMAAFFKSGSLYQCVPEEGYRCAKYMGNRRNMMNSVAIIETLPEVSPRRSYLVAMMSNVLRLNSAWDHARLGVAIDEMVRTRQAVAVRDKGNANELQDAGRSD